MKPAALDFVDNEARWLAACLAHESEQADRVLNDPFASHLAGLRGARLFEERVSEPRAFAVVLAVAVVDELIHRAVLDHHLHAVLHFGAGLDTRPYRLGLPNDLRWVELDQDVVFLYKDFRLAHVSPTCRVGRVSVDVWDPAQRAGALRRAARGVARGLLLTENVLDRFAPDALQALGTHLPAGLKWWILGTPPGTPADHDQAIAAICGARWKVADRRPLAREARRLAPRRAPLALRAADATGSEMATVWLLRRAA